jgi:hypothetical protein
MNFKIALIIGTITLLVHGECFIEYVIRKDETSRPSTLANKPTYQYLAQTSLIINAYVMTEVLITAIIFINSI